MSKSWKIGDIVNGWLVESSPCNSKKQAEGYAWSLRKGIRWKVEQNGGRWWLLVKE
jgi:hypothetical protein